MRIIWIFLVLFQCSNGLDRFSNCRRDFLQKNRFQSGNCSLTDFLITTSSSSYDLNQAIAVIFRTRSSERTFTNILLYAQDDIGRSVGRWNTDDSQMISMPCGGVQQRETTAKTSIRATWYSSADAIEGNIHFKAIVIENGSMVYTDCYDHLLKPRHEQKEKVLNVIPPIDNRTSVPSPTADVAMNVSWIFEPRTSTTVVRMTVTNLKSSQWAAIGLTLERGMGKAHVFICKRLTDDTIQVDRYINPSGHQYPELASSDAGGLFTPGDQLFRDGLVICQFNLSHFTSNTSTDVESVQPLSQSTSYYPIFAVGALDSDNDPQKHAKDSRKAMSNLVQLNQNEIVLYKISGSNSSDLRKFVRIHGILMVITWIFLVSTGILLSRYFKAVEIHRYLSNLCTWFTIHRFLMCLATILTTLAFLFILVSLQGTWIEQGFTRSFAHSILGSIVIGLVFFQPFIALFRCHTSSSYRVIFNCIHATVGFGAFLLSIIVLFLATYFPLFSNDRARLLLIGWIFWIGTVFILFELIEYLVRKRSSRFRYTSTGNQSNGHDETTPILITSEDRRKATPMEQRLKCVLLFLHLLVAGSISILFSFLIVFP